MVRGHGKVFEGTGMTYYEKNKERIKAYNRKHYAENRERKMQQSMEWQKAHPLQMYEIHRRYYLKNVEKRQEYQREYYRRKKAVG